MTSRFPMICDSCANRVPGTFRCTAYPDGITLDPMKAELHEEPRPDQDNEVVYDFNPAQADEQLWFLKFRHSLLGADAPDPAALAAEPG